MIKREDALKALEGEEFDVVVVGGGVTGAGVALDAASRGYSVALIERNDYACGTSSRSSKMVHGGLRYLQNLDIALVREALVERKVMVEQAPHLVWPLPFMVVAFEGDRIDRKIGVGLNMYDVMQRGNSSSRSDRQLRAERAGRSLRQYERSAAAGTDWSPARHRTVGPEEVIELVPALAGRDPKAAYLFYDCQTDDVRLVLTILGEAERYGAVMANRIDVTKLLERDGKTVGVIGCDSESGDEVTVRGRHIVNATGVWADRLKPAAFDQADVPVIRPSRGTHITLDAADIPLNGALVVPAGGDRTIFALPWMGRTLIGTTDRDYEGSLDHILPAEDDYEYLLDAVNNFFGVSLTNSDVTGAYAGVRPLISTGDSKKSVDISRKAELYEVDGGMITITGGKLTTWRRMAETVIDLLVARDGRTAPCLTEDIPLGEPVDPADLPVAGGVGDDSAAHLARRYGYAAANVLAIVRSDPGLAAPIVDGFPDLLAEVVTAARLEQARCVGDVLLRRTRLALLAARELVPSQGEPAAAARCVAEVLAGELGWNASRIESELSAWAELAASEGVRKL